MPASDKKEDKNMPDISIKDFILSEENLKGDNEQKKIQKKTVEYDVLFCSGPDFAVKRKSAKSESVLVVMVSQEQFYVKTASGSIKKLQFDSLSQFMDGANENGVPLVDANGNSPGWISSLPKDLQLRKDLIEVLQNQDAIFLMKKDMYSFRSRENKKGPIVPQPETDMDISCKVFNEFAKYAPRMEVKEAFLFVRSHDYNRVDPDKLESGLICLLIGEQHHYYRHNDGEIVPVADILIKKWGWEGVRTAIRLYMLSPCTMFPESNAVRRTFFSTMFMGRRVSDFPCQKWSDFVFCESCRQGYADQLTQWVSCWCDYLDMSQICKGETDDKYPSYLASKERTVLYRYNKIKALRDEQSFLDAVDEYSKYEYKSGKYMIIVPRKPEDMILEGQRQSNCVGGYIASVANRETRIFFMRKRTDKSRSYVTVEVCNNDELGQVEACCHRQPDSEAMVWIRKWHRKCFVDKDFSEDTEDDKVIDVPVLEMKAEEKTAEPEESSEEKAAHEVKDNASKADEPSQQEEGKDVPQGDSDEEGLSLFEEAEEIDEADSIVDRVAEKTVICNRMDYGQITLSEVFFMDKNQHEKEETLIDPDMLFT